MSIGRQTVFEGVNSKKKEDFSPMKNQGSTSGIHLDLPSKEVSNMIRVNNHTAAINSSRTEVAMKRDTKIDDQKKDERVSSA